MELTTGLSLIGIATATAVTFMWMRAKATSLTVKELRDRLNWEQGNQPATPAAHARVTYHA